MEFGLKRLCFFDAVRGYQIMQCTGRPGREVTARHDVVDGRAGHDRRLANNKQTERTWHVPTRNPGICYRIADAVHPIPI